MNTMKKMILSSSIAILTGTMFAADIYDFNRGWLFLRQSSQTDIIPWRTHRNGMANAKANTADLNYKFVGLRADEQQYRKVDLPHDWSIEEAFSREENGEQGFRRRGWGYYRKHFMIPESWRGKHIEIQFDGIATQCNMWYNNTEFHHNFSGYNSMTLDLTPMAKYGQENLIVVEVNADIMEGWWYEGAGIYRDVRLIVSDPCHIETESGIYVKPELVNDEWVVSGEIEVVNYGRTTEDVTVEYQIIGPDGSKTEPAKAGATKSVPFQKSVVPFSFKPGKVALWDTDDPKLYQLVAVTKIGDRETDRKSTTFGYRTFRFDPQTGFYLNGRHLILQGTCNHQDHAGVGTAMPASIEEFRILKLKELGSNAYRTSHNAPSKNILDLCDKYGLVVIDENRSFNAAPLWAQNIEWQVKRDRNHPCVVAWSIWNEEPLQGSELGQETARYLVGHVRKYDTTRPTVAGMNGGFFEQRSGRNSIDMVGFNYQYNNIDRFHQLNPNTPTMLTEGASAFETRGEFTTDRTKLTCTQYDEYGASWGSTHRFDWKAVLTRPFLCGTFVWTGFDYHGEPTPYNNAYPANSSYFGIMDLCGFPKNAFYLRQAMWLKTPVVSIMPHWTWPGKEGQPIKVFCSSNCEEVTFVLNGKEIGTYKVDKYEMLTQNINYEPGILVAIGKNGGKEVARSQVETTTAPVALKLEPFRGELDGDGYAATPITISAVDEKGRVVPDADCSVKIEVIGPGRNIGVGNGDPTSTEPDKANSRKLFHGLAQVIVQTNPGATEPIQIRVVADGLKDGSCTIQTKAVPAIPSIDAYTPRRTGGGAPTGWGQW